MVAAVPFSGRTPGKSLAPAWGAVCEATNGFSARPSIGALAVVLAAFAELNRQRGASIAPNDPAWCQTATIVVELIQQTGLTVKKKGGEA